MAKPIAAWESSDALVERLRAQHQAAMRRHMFRNGVLLMVGFWSLVYAVWTLAVWVTR